MDCVNQGPVAGATPHLWVSFFGQNHPPLRAPLFNGPHFIAERAPVIALAVYPGPMDPVPDRVVRAAADFSLDSGLSRGGT